VPGPTRADGYTELEYPGFGKGLNLRDQPNVVGPDQALDALNVIFTSRGGVQQRPGYLKFTDAEGTNAYDSLGVYYTSSGTKQLLAGAGNRLEGLATDGTIVDSDATPTASPHFFARFGGPTNELAFAGNGTDELFQWDGSTWTHPTWTTETPTGKFVAVTPWDNRLINARFDGSTAGDNPSTVRFAEPNDPLDFGTNNYEDLLPGDGEEIMGVCAWREFVFVFKESKFFVFYGTHSDESGNPVFDYRPVDTGIGAVASRGIAVGRDGVYFLARTGVYRTVGGEPMLISDDLDGVFAQQSGVAPPFYSGAVISNAHIEDAALEWWDERVYVAVPTNNAYNDRTFVFDTRYQWWSVYDLPIAAMVRFRVSNDEELLFAYSTGTQDIGRHRQSDSDDDGTEIVSFCNYGWTDDGIPQQHVLRAMKLWGKGTLTVAVAVDFQTAAGGDVVDFSIGADTWGDGTGADNWGDGSDSSDVWSSGVILNGKYIPHAYKGSVFSLQLSSQGGEPWAIYRGSKLLRDIETPTRIGS